MQTTLLGLAIAIILALVAALVGPLVIDWGSHRALFETEASRLIGVPVRVTGTIDARLLPSPRLVLHDIVIGNNTDAVRARSLGVEFALGPLMRGEWRAAELRLAGPQVSLGLDKSGHVRAPNLAVAFKPDELSIDRLTVEDGSIAFNDAASGASLTLGGLSFDGEARSLAGPIKGAGAVTFGGRVYPYRLTVGRIGDDGGARVRVNIAAADHPLAIEADGALAFAGGEPRFDGTVSLSQPVGISSRGATTAAAESHSVSYPTLAPERQDQGQRAIGAHAECRLSLWLGGSWFQVGWRRRSHIRGTPALQRCPVRTADRRRSRGVERGWRASVAGRGHPQTGGAGRRCVSPRAAVSDRHRHRSGHARRRHCPEPAR